jgi:adenylate cyclase
MHVYLRGSVEQRLRLASGLVLFAFAAAHFLNHALGLVSLEVMHAVQDLRTLITRSLPGTIVLGAALVTHITLGLYKLASRNTLRMPLWEALQILIALMIPFLLFPHIVNTRVANWGFGVNDSYLYELFRLWPDRAVMQSLLLLLVWVHGCIGLHYWLRLSDRYQNFAPALLAVAVAIPVAALAGFAVAGRTTGEIMSDPVALAQLKERSNWPDADSSLNMAWLRDVSQYLFAAILALIAAVLGIRRLAGKAGATLTVSYRDGPTIEVPRGTTILEASRASGMPHASVCGGRARCYTCRIRVEKGLNQLPAPSGAEAVALRVMEATPDIRLACQVRPVSAVTVSILNKPAVPGPVQVEFIEVKAVVAAHARAVLTRELAEVNGSDADAIRQWFRGKVTYPLIVRDVVSAGFALRGGRIDYLQDRPVAALLLDSAEQPVSLFVLPVNDADMVAVRGRRNGYNVVGWSDAGYAYFAASTIDSDALDKLQDAYSTKPEPAEGTP